jgi:hypothetical protein
LSEGAGGLPIRSRRNNVHTLNRVGLMAASAAGLMALSASPALAHYCTNESNDKNANVAWILIDDFESFEPIGVSDNLKLTRNGGVAGAGFYDLYFDADGSGSADAGELVGSNIFLHAGLPVSALSAAGCGHGVFTAIPEEFELEPCPAG